MLTPETLAPSCLSEMAQVATSPALDQVCQFHPPMVLAGFDR